MKKIICLICVACITLSLCGCLRSGLNPETTVSQSPAGQPSVPETTVPAAVPETVAPTEPQPVLDAQLFPMDFYFSSGAGGWATEMILNSDYSFSGAFFDSDMGDSGEVYPKGTYYVSNFWGSFRILSQIDEYSYSMELMQLETEIPVGTIWIEDGIRYIASDAYGLGGTQYVLYLPETPMAQLPESLTFWLPYWGELPETLSGYVIWDPVNETAFFAQG